MQSGITASQELLDAFKTLVSTPTQRGLITTINGESLTLASVLPAHGSFDSDLTQLDDLLTTDKAAYVILRRYEDAGDVKPAFVMVTYVPDAAKVREKTLVASTRNTLLRELGKDLFAENIFATMKAELTAEGFKRHDAHEANPAPLTEEERVLGEVRRLEAEVSYGTAGRKSHTSGGVAMPISPEALFALKSLNSASTFNLVQLIMDTAKETIELDTCDAVNVEDLHSKISSTEPRYSFFVFHHEYEGEDQSPIVFIYTCPSGSKIKERMLYATCKRSVVEVAESEAGVQVAKKLEAASAEEITKEMLMDEFHPKVEEKKMFARPKRPGRR